MLKIILRNAIGKVHVSYIAVIEPHQITPEIKTELKRYGLMLKMNRPDKIAHNDLVLATLDLDPKKSTFLQTLHTVVFATPEFFIYQGLGENFLLSSWFKDIDTYELSYVALPDKDVEDRLLTEEQLSIRNNVKKLIPMDKNQILVKRINRIIQIQNLIPSFSNSSPSFIFLPSQSANKVLPQLKLAAVNNKLGITDSKDRTPYVSKYNNEVDCGSFDKMALSTTDYFIPFVIKLTSIEVRDILIKLRNCEPIYKNLLTQARALHERKAEDYIKNLDRVDNLWNTFQINLTSNLITLLQKKTSNNLNNSNLPPDKIFSNLTSAVSAQLDKAHLDTETEAVLIHNIKNNFIHSFELVMLDIWIKLLKLENDITKTSRLAALDTFLEDFGASIHFENILDIHKTLKRQEAFLRNPQNTAGYENNDGAYIAFCRDYQSLNLDRTASNFNMVREELPANIQAYRADYREAVLEKFKELNNTVAPIQDPNMTKRPVHFPAAPDPKRPVNFPYFTFIDGKFAWDECVTNAHNPAVSQKIQQDIAEKIDNFLTYAHHELAECKQLEVRCTYYKTAADNAIAALGAIQDSLATLNIKFATVKANYNKCVEEAAKLKRLFSSIGNLNTKSAIPANHALQELENRLNAYRSQVHAIAAAIDKVRKAKDIPALRQAESAAECELNNKCESHFRHQLTNTVQKIHAFQHEILLKEFLSQIKAAAQNVAYWNNNTTKFLCIGGSRSPGFGVKVPQVIAETINAFNNVDIFSLNLAQTKALFKQIYTSASESAARRDKRFFQTQKEATQQWNKLILAIEPNKFTACNLGEALARNKKLAEDLAVVMNTKPFGKVDPEISIASITRPLEIEPSVSIAPGISP